MHFNVNRKSRGSVLGVVLAVLVGGACVTQEEYDEAVAAAKRYEKEFYRLDKHVNELRDENRRLRQQLDASAIEAANPTADIDQRLDDVRGILAELGPNPGDVTKFQVDGGYVYRVKNSILFDFASADLRPAARAVMDQIAADIKSQPHGRVYVRGHSDNVPVVRPETLAKFPHGNLHLSAERAINVGGYLVEQGGVVDDRLVVMGFGSTEPVASNDTEEGRQQNRRVDIFVEDA